MVLLITTINAKPRQAQELKQVLVLLAQRARKMPGCLSGQVDGDVEQADSLGFIEAWETQADEWHTEDWEVLTRGTPLLGVRGQVQFCTVTETHEERLDGTPDEVRGP
jgi:hypothetical protein